MDKLFASEPGVRGFESRCHRGKKDSNVLYIPRRHLSRGEGKDPDILATKSARFSELENIGFGGYISTEPLSAIYNM